MATTASADHRLEQPAGAGGGQVLLRQEAALSRMSSGERDWREISSGSTYGGFHSHGGTTTWMV